MREQKKNTAGFGLVEVVVSVGILSAVLFSLYGYIQNVLRMEQRSTTEIQATYLLLEGVEAVRLLRDAGWEDNITTLDLDTEYHLTFTGGTWQTTSTPGIIDGRFTRTVRLEEVVRDGSDRIASSGTVDPGTRKLVVTLTWPHAGSTVTRTVNAYVMDIFKN